MVKVQPQVYAALVVCSTVGMVAYMNTQTGQNPLMAERQVDGEALSLGQMAAQDAFGQDLFSQDGFGNSNDGKSIKGEDTLDRLPSRGESAGEPRDGGGIAPSFGAGSQTGVDILKIEAALQAPISPDATGIMSQIAATKKLLGEARAELEALRSTPADLVDVLPRISPDKLSKSQRAKAPPIAFLKTHKVRGGGARQEGRRDVNTDLVCGVLFCWLF